MIKPVWKVAKVTNCEVELNSPPRSSYVKIKFYLLEPFKLSSGRRLRTVYSFFNEKSGWLVGSLYSALGVPDISLIFPDSRLLKRYCKIFIKEEEFNGVLYPKVIRYAPLNPHIKSKAELKLEAERLEESRIGESSYEETDKDLED